MKQLFLLLFLLICVNSNAQNKVNFNGLQALENLHEKARVQGVSAAAQKIEAVVLMNPGWNHETLSQYDVEIVVEVSDDILVLSIPADKVIAFSEEKDVKYVEFGNTYEVAMDFARPATGVTEVQQGFNYDGETLSYDGTGVVTGLMDVGIDPNHPNFLSADGESRVKQAYNYSYNISAITPEEVKAFTTDAADQSHGTHVAGIMAGKAYSERGRYCLIPEPTGGNMVQRAGQIPFYGVATGSDLVMASGSFSEANIIKACYAVSKYAAKEGKPFVLNLSMSKSDGPHDGSGALEKTLSVIGAQGIICLASGNNGNRTAFVGKEFTMDGQSVSTFITDATCTGIDFWGNDEKPFTVAVSIYTNGKATKVCEISAADKLEAPSATFFNNMNGTFDLRTEVNALNNRYHVQLSGNFWPKNDVRVAITVTGSEGQKVYCYGCGSAITQFSSYNTPGYVEGTTNGNFSNIAAAAKTIAIGSYNTSYAWGAFNKMTYNLVPVANYTIGDVTFSTAYGTSFQGVNIPHVCAPGTAIKSSYNRYNTETMSEDELGKLCARIDKDVEKNAYWGTMSGTSMASPFAAGTFALWLQADPTLTTEDILSIIQKTSNKPVVTNSDENVRWGAGKIDALAGIKEVLARKAATNGLTGVVESNDVIITREGERQVLISAPASTSIAATLYTLQGMEALNATSNSTELSMDATALPAGFYILRVTPAGSAAVTRRILIK